MNVDDKERIGQQEVLVVDDTPASLQLLTRILIDYGYRVRPASGGLLALRTVAARLPDIILLDVKMPDMDGFAVCRRLKADSRSADVPVLFISASGETVDKIKGFEAGGVDYITKPFQAEEVLARIRTQLQIRELTRRLQDANETLERRVEERTAKLDQANRELQQEITQRKQSEKRFRTLVENLPVKVYIKNRDSVYTACNPSYARDLGIEPHEIQGKTDLDFHPRELAEKYRADDRRLMDSGRGEELEEEYVRNGRHYWIQVIKTPLTDESHTVTGILGVFWDITERRKAEEAIKESEERYRIITEAAQDAIITIIDQNSEIQFVNPATERIFGYTSAELQGKPLTMLMPERLRQAHFDGVKRHIATGRKHIPWGAIELPGLHKDGREIPLEITYGEFIKDGKYLFIGIARDITERKKAEETIKYQAYHDLLTRLPNKELFTDLLRREVAHMQRIGKKLAVLFLDMDQFKNINDSLGHSAGDALIREAADRLKNSIRECDTIARIGGDDFLILLPLLSGPRDVSILAGKFMEAVRKVFVIDHHELVLTASIGISIYPEDGDNPEALIKNADIALHYAKDQGRNNFQFYNPSINFKTLELIIFENRLRNAVDRGELVVHYQPQQDLKTGKITGAEALVRWNHPELGLLQPTQFIPLAEEIGVVTEIDQWVLRTACEQLRAWEASGYAPQYMTTNLSARQFQQPDLPKMISAVLKETGLKPEQLGIEITETVAMQDTELTAINVNRLNKMGVRFLIDDFGTGYSSLSYLKKLPIHKLKIDKSFINYLSTDIDYQAITNAIIAMAHILKVKVVAEGVETENQLSFLISRDCDEMQGFLFSEPVPAMEFEKILVLERAGRIKQSA